MPERALPPAQMAEAETVPVRIVNLTTPKHWRRISREFDSRRCASDGGGDGFRALLTWKSQNTLSSNFSSQEDSRFHVSFELRASPLWLSFTARLWHRPRFYCEPTTRAQKSAHAAMRSNGSNNKSKPLCYPCAIFKWMEHNTVELATRPFSKARCHLYRGCSCVDCRSYRP